MKKLNSMSLMLLYIIAILATSCKKSSMDDLSVTINNPVEGTAYTGSVEMSFSINAPNGLDSCVIALSDISGSATNYSNNFFLGTDVRNKTTFTFSDTQNTLPIALTPAKFIITVVDLKKKRFTKTINVSIKQ